jgi:hypothetical protein
VSFTGTPYQLASTGETVLCKQHKRWDRSRGVWVITGLDDTEFVACGSGAVRKLVLLVDVRAYAVEHGYTVARAALSWPVGA